jgi:AcrR family transcriptional regulator
VTHATRSRRERLRASTIDEIKASARNLLISDGVAGISLRAIARDMGMTAAALYRYYPSLEALVEALCVDLFDECRLAMEQARDAHEPTELAARMYAVCHAFRAWSIAHPAEFGLMFGSPVPGLADPIREINAPKHAAADRFAGVFSDLFAAIWQRAPFPVPADEDLSPILREQLAAYVDGLGVALPLGAVQIFLSCWIRLYGLVAMEVFGHLHFALSDVAPMFDAELQTAAGLLGLTGSPTAAP